MIAQPLRLSAADGRLTPCEPAAATHLRIRMPGPFGQLDLPVMITGTRAGTGNWTWNGSVTAPTLRPSVLTTSRHRGIRCHSWITDGAARFLEDTTHELRGQTIPLLPLDPPAPEAAP